MTKKSYINKEDVLNILGDSINNDKDYHRAIMLINNLPSVTLKENEENEEIE